MYSANYWCFYRLMLFENRVCSEKSGITVRLECSSVCANTDSSSDSCFWFSSIPFCIQFRSAIYSWDSANFILLTPSPWFSSFFVFFDRRCCWDSGSRPESGCGCSRPRSCVSLWPGAAAEDFVDRVLLLRDLLNWINYSCVSVKLVFLS